MPTLKDMVVVELDNVAPSIAQQQRVGVIAAEVLHPQLLDTS